MDEARRGQFVSDKEIEELYQLHRRLSSLREA
jgi:hypothetical protein